MRTRKLLFWIFVIPTLAVQAWVLFGNGWNAYAHMDKILHIGYGASMFFFLVAYRNWNALDAFLAALTFEYLWEAGELTTDILHIKPVNPYPNYFFFDGVTDILGNAFGACAAWLLLKLFAGGTKQPAKLRARAWMTAFSFGMILVAAGGSIIALQLRASPDHFALIGIVSVAMLAWLLTQNRKHK